MSENPNSFYVTLFSNSYMKVFPNTIAAFTVAYEIDLCTDRWEVGLCEFSCPLPNVGTLRTNVIVGERNAMIYCNFISPQFVSEKKLRFLRMYIHPTAFCNHVFENVYYMPLERRMFRDIRIKIADLSGI